ncbi:MAG TPA: ATP-binding protein, partial [Acidimicrobiia bacterium]|nr:ATP-binding protein [Acidimicrobiia bacterium]
GEPWRRRPHRFVRFAAVFLLLVVVAVIVAAANGYPHFLWLLPLLWLGPFFVFGAFISFGRMRNFPIRDLVDAAARLAEGDYQVRMKPVPGGPMKRIVSSFNGMAERLEAASTQRRQLMADLGHELRTPLTVIQAEIEAMIDGVRGRDDAELEMLLGQTSLMGRLLEDLRTLSLTEAGELKLDIETVEMRSLLSDAAGPFGKYEVFVIESDDGEVRCDPVRIKQVLTNLIANAARSMPEGGTIRIEARRRNDGWTVVVADQGRGIAPEDLERVFDRFVKSADSTGSGLGLSIARDLVVAHRGTINARSELGRGTEIEFTVP